MKKLKVQFTPDRGGYHMTIVEQSHRYLEFGNNDYVWQASNGLRLISLCSPIADFKKAHNRLHVRGQMVDKDNEGIFVSSLQEIEHIKQAVAEYNRVFNRVAKPVTPPPIPTTQPVVESVTEIAPEQNTKQLIVVDSNTNYEFKFPGYTVLITQTGVIVQK